MIAILPLGSTLGSPWESSQGLYTFTHIHYKFLTDHSKKRTEKLQEKLLCFSFESLTVILLLPFSICLIVNPTFLKILKGSGD